MTVSKSVVKDFLQRKASEEEKSNQILWSKAKEEADSLVKLIIHEINPEKIIQWGSILQKENFRDYSDIDIALYFR